MQREWNRLPDPLQNAPDYEARLAAWSGARDDMVKRERRLERTLELRALARARVAAAEGVGILGPDELAEARQLARETAVRRNAG